MNQDLPKNFDPQEVESRWYAHWESSGYFRADAASRKTAFVIVMPPRM
jgi:valyl-tRNA synthetase